MPGGDRTGPMGMGAMTGRGAGFCTGTDRFGNTGAGFGRGFGMGAGRGVGFRRISGGRGWRNQFYATGQPGWIRNASYGGPQGGNGPLADKETLKQRSQILQSELAAINKQLDEME